MKIWVRGAWVLLVVLSLVGCQAEAKKKKKRTPIHNTASSPLIPEETVPQDEWTGTPAQLDQAISIRWVGREFVKGSLESDHIMDRLFLTFEVTNKSNWPIEGIGVNLTFYNSLGDEIWSGYMPFEDRIGYGDKIEATMVMDYNSLIKEHVRLGAADIESTSLVHEVETLRLHGGKIFKR